MALNLALAWQGSPEDYAFRYQGALSLDSAKFNVGLAYNAGDKDEEEIILLMFLLNTVNVYS